MALLEIRQVGRVFGDGDTQTVVLRGIDFTVESGEFVAIMGRSGSGKSTLLHILGLLDRPTTGTYLLNDTDTARFSDEERAHFRNATIGFVFQVFHLLPRVTVLENVLLPLMYSTVPAREWEPRALVALEQVELTHRLSHFPPQLSGGEKQRVAIARALITKPQVILADEPTGNLDSRTGERVMQTIDRLHHAGHTIILITHETPTAAYAQRIITLHDGLIVSDETTAQRHSHYVK